MATKRLTKTFRQKKEKVEPYTEKLRLAKTFAEQKRKKKKQEKRLEARITKWDQTRIFLLSK